MRTARPTDFTCICVHEDRRVIRHVVARSETRSVNERKSSRREIGKHATLQVSSGDERSPAENHVTGGIAA